MAIDTEYRTDGNKPFVEGPSTLNHILAKTAFPLICWPQVTLTDFILNSVLQGCQPSQKYSCYM